MSDFDRQFRAAQRAYDNMMPPGTDDLDIEYAPVEWQCLVSVGDSEIEVCGVAWYEPDDYLELALSDDCIPQLTAAGGIVDGVLTMDVREHITGLISIPSWDNYVQKQTKGWL